MPIAFRRLSRRLLSTAKGRAGLVTRQVSSRNTLPFCRGIPYRKDGTSSSAPHTPSPAAGCSKSLNLQQQRRRYGKNTDPFAGGTFCTRRRALSVQTPKPHPQLLSTQSSSSCCLARRNPQTVVKPTTHGGSCLGNLHCYTQQQCATATLDCSAVWRPFVPQTAC